MLIHYSKSLSKLGASLFPFQTNSPYLPTAGLLLTLSSRTMATPSSDVRLEDQLPLPPQPAFIRSHGLRRHSSSPNMHERRSFPLPSPTMSSDLKVRRSLIFEPGGQPLDKVAGKHTSEKDGQQLPPASVFRLESLTDWGTGQRHIDEFEPGQSFVMPRYDGVDSDGCSPVLWSEDLQAPSTPERWSRHSLEDDEIGKLPLPERPLVSPSHFELVDPDVVDIGDIDGRQTPRTPALSTPSPSERMRRINQTIEEMMADLRGCCVSPSSVELPDRSNRSVEESRSYTSMDRNELDNTPLAISSSTPTLPSLIEDDGSSPAVLITPTRRKRPVQSLDEESSPVDSGRCCPDYSEGSSVMRNDCYHDEQELNSSPPLATNTGYDDFGYTGYYQDYYSQSESWESWNWHKNLDNRRGCYQTSDHGNINSTVFYGSEWGQGAPSASAPHSARLGSRRRPPAQPLPGLKEESSEELIAFNKVDPANVATQSRHVEQDVEFDWRDGIWNAHARRQDNDVVVVQDQSDQTPAEKSRTRRWVEVLKLLIVRLFRLRKYTRQPEKSVCQQHEPSNQNTTIHGETTNTVVSRNSSRSKNPLLHGQNVTVTPPPPTFSSRTFFPGDRYPTSSLLIMPLPTPPPMAHCRDTVYEDDGDDYGFKSRWSPDSSSVSSEFFGCGVWRIRERVGGLVRRL
ncbi:hypothetical protein K470DRAFT_278180 [Piedraia hortae CBS 480.64]|uniref:Uncharacterized protein n=1 Tax=Piedraia hortae CBS 480.64 TaxID=1314780 RepID=A0A6A7BVY8_9PEZI|nr:hypothetical protein K470DRAFT_278180 [Piedraia hortae CBS 480.64]